MAKKFNVTGICFPDEHYMADVSEKLEQTRRMVEAGEYFIINRPRQYGKTTMLYVLANALRNSGEYIVFNMSFEGIGDAVFREETDFSQGFIRQLAKYAQVSAPDLVEWLRGLAPDTTSLEMVSGVISELVRKGGKRVVLMIDEVDKSSNNQLFISFLGMLRNKYLERKTFPTFHSVVLAGVHDVKSLKLKIRPESEQKYNSPWNIAADFTVDMNLHPHEIKPMLDEYAADKGVKMDTGHIAERLFYYTSGYPFLVSRLCKMLDEDIMPRKSTMEWTDEDLIAAVQRLISESNTNFDSLAKNLEHNEALYQLVYSVAVEGIEYPYSLHDPVTNLGILYGIFVNRDGLAIHNRIYQEVIVNYMTMRMLRLQKAEGNVFETGYRNPDNSLNMEAALLKFQSFMREQYNRKDRDFLERNGRLVFLAFLKPIINGAGYDFKEPQISDERRLDVIITYFQHKYLAELKIWRGEALHEKGLLQLADYLDGLSLTEGYLVIFDHGKRKSWKKEWTEVEGKRVFAVWV